MNSLVKTHESQFFCVYRFCPKSKHHKLKSRRHRFYENFCWNFSQSFLAFVVKPVVNYFFLAPLASLGSLAIDAPDVIEQNDHFDVIRAPAATYLRPQSMAICSLLLKYYVLRDERPRDFIFREAFTGSCSTVVISGHAAAPFTQPLPCLLWPFSSETIHFANPEP